ncbi:hypothetical protein WAI453_011353 [Rhynchosporium graminicola]
MNTSSWAEKYNIPILLHTAVYPLKVTDSITFLGTKFLTFYDSIEKLLHRLQSYLVMSPCINFSRSQRTLQGMTTLFGHWLKNGEYNLEITDSRTYLNEKFPEIRTKSIEELNIKEAWA